MACGLFYDAHRAADDCHALLTLLNQELSHTSATVLADLPERAAEDRPGLGAAVAVRAEGYPEAPQLPLERRHRRPPEVLVPGCRRGNAGIRAALSRERDLPARHRHFSAGVHRTRPIFSERLGQLSQSGCMFKSRRDCQLSLSQASHDMVLRRGEQLAKRSPAIWRAASDW